MKKKIVVVCPYLRDRRELQRNASILRNYEIIFDDHTQDWLKRNLYVQLSATSNHAHFKKNLQEIYDNYAQQSIDGITSSGDYPGSVLMSILAEKLTMRAPTPSVVLACHHKYYSRLLQQQHVPEAVPQFCLIDPYKFDEKQFSFPFPLFIKPVKSYFSYNAQTVNTIDELSRIVPNLVMPQSFLAPFSFFLKQHTQCGYAAHCLIAESLLHGIQTTVEGYIFENQAYILGVVDSIMFENTISFKRFEYPSLLPQAVQDRMGAIAKKVMTGIGFNNGLFNVEMMYNPEADEIHIIEINPRMASQFADLYERVDGTNSYELLCDIAVGKKPEPKRRKGEFKIAASCVLRLFEDQKVIKMPSPQNIAKIYELFPDARLELYAKEGQKLSEQMQDGKSFRYGLVHLGGTDKQDLLHRFEECKKLLDFVFEPV